LQCVLKIPVDIRTDFFHPEFFPGFGLLKAYWAFMPKAAINEDYNFLFRKYDIGFAREVKMDTIASDSLRPEKFS